MIWQDFRLKRMGEKAGFTLVELVVVISIITALFAILLPAVQMARESGRRASCMNNVRQTALATLGFEGSYGHLPAGIAAADSTPFRSQTWLQRILPFLEKRDVYERAVKDYGQNPSPFSHIGLQTVIATYQCPSDPDSGEVHLTHQGRVVASTNYLGVNGLDWSTEDGVFYRDSKTKMIDILDGASNTLLIGERPPSSDYWYGWWYASFGQQSTGSCDILLGVRETKAPAIVETYLESCEVGPYHFRAGELGKQCDTLHFWSHHPGGAVFAFAGGSVHFFAYDSADSILPDLATRRGRESVVLPD